MATGFGYGLRAGRPRDPCMAGTTGMREQSGYTPGYTCETMPTSCNRLNCLSEPSGVSGLSGLNRLSRQSGPSNRIKGPSGLSHLCRLGRLNSSRGFSRLSRTSPEGPGIKLRGVPEMRLRSVISTTEI